MSVDDKILIAALEKSLYPAGDTLQEYDPILDAASDKTIVLIGESTHGTHEFYRARAELTQRLISEENFHAVAVEADWPDAYYINRYVRGMAPQATAEEVLKKFQRFPTWMWANREIFHFINWLQAFNTTSLPGRHAVGFYGLDLYSMNTSIQDVISYLEKMDPAFADMARERYRCLEAFLDNPQLYGAAMRANLTESCEEKIVSQLVDLKRKSCEYLARDGIIAEDEYFCAKQNARLVYNAERYYRSLFRPRIASGATLWNMRDRYMFETLQNLRHHLTKQHNKDIKLVIWAHNSHIGNAAATEMSSRGEINLGQLARETYGQKTLRVGFSTAEGTVTAANDWDSETKRKNIRRPIPSSYEDIFHRVSQKNFLINLTEACEATDLLQSPRLQRAIGVIYRPETERESHYYYANLPEQYDFLLHFDHTTALEPLDATPHWHKGDLDETYPSGL